MNINKRKKIMTKRLALFGTLLTTCALALSACGSSGGTTEEAAAPSKAEASKPASGTLRLFAYDDTVTDEQLDPFRKARTN